MAVGGLAPIPQGPEVTQEVVVGPVPSLVHAVRPALLPLDLHLDIPPQVRPLLKLSPNMRVVEMTPTMSMTPPNLSHRIMTHLKPPPKHCLKTWQLLRLMREMVMTQLRLWMVTSLLKHWGGRGLGASLKEEVEAEVDQVRDQSLDLGPGLKVNLDLVTDLSQDLAPDPTPDPSQDLSPAPGQSQDPSPAQHPGQDLGQGPNLAPEVDQDQGVLLRAKRSR